MIRRELPADAAALRQVLYAGEIVQAAPTPASRKLVEAVRTRLGEVLGCAPGAIREVAQTLPNAELFTRIGEVRKELYLEKHFHTAVCDVVTGLGFEAMRIAIDPLRLRVVLSHGHENPLAAPVYHPHRDTWYAHPASLIAWWIPLDVLAEQETFVFYPDRFAAPVENDSEIFDYGEWVRDGWELKIGWQKLGHDARYPRAAPGVDGGPAVGFSCRTADNLLFSGAHFHATLPQVTGRTRFSLDFRIVDLDDHAAGLGAPNVDNRSRGSALRDYIRAPRCGET